MNAPAPRAGKGKHSEKQPEATQYFNDGLDQILGDIAAKDSENEFLEPETQESMPGEESESEDSSADEKDTEDITGSEVSETEFESTEESSEEEAD